MLSIRLSQVGKKNKKMFRLTVAENTKDPYGHALEILGSYNPHSKELNIKAERVLHWIKNGAQPSNTVNNLLITNKIIEGEKKKTVKISNKRKATIAKKKTDQEKAAEDKAAKEAKEKELAEAAPAPEAVEAVETVEVAEAKEETPTENA
jgi:small subunit ribosomal protein S16